MGLGYTSVMEALRKYGTGLHKRHGGITIVWDWATQASWRHYNSMGLGYRREPKPQRYIFYEDKDGKRV